MDSRLIMAIVFVIWVGIGPFAGVLALTLHSIATLGKLFSEQVESIDPGPIETITATGANWLQVIIYGVVQWINLLQYRQAGVSTLAIAIVVATLDYVSAKVREKIV